MRQIALIIPLIILIAWWQYPPPGTPTPTPPNCEVDLCPSGDTSGQLDTAGLRAVLETDRHITLAYGDYYFTRIDSQIGLVPILYNNTTIDGGDWNMTTLHMVGTEDDPSEDWYLFHAVERDGLTLKNMTIDGSLLDTVAGQTHGAVFNRSSNVTLENVRGQYIYGDTTKLLYTCSNCKFLNTEHLHNGRSGLSFRGTTNPPTTTNGGITVDGLLCINISDQCIDMEPGIAPGEIILSNGRIYAPNNTGFCLSIVGGVDASGNPFDLRLVLDNWQVYCRAYTYNVREVIITNSLFDASLQGGSALTIQKAGHDVIVSDSVIIGNGVDGILKLIVHNSGRPSHVLLADLIIKVEGNSQNGGMGIQLYDVSNVAISNVTIQNESGLVLGYGVYYRQVIAGVERGYIQVDGARIANATRGVYISDTSSALSTIDTLTVQNSHFRNVTTGITLVNPTGHSAPYVRAWNFDNNVYGEGVTTPMSIGSVFQ